MYPIQIAETKPRGRSDDEGLWWHQWRIRKLTQEEFYAVRGAGKIPHDKFYVPWFVEERYVRTGPGGRTEEWEPVSYHDTPGEAVDDMGGTSFLEADSLHPIHQAFVQHYHSVRDAEAAHYNAGRQTEAARREYSQYVHDCNLEYKKKLGKGGDADKLLARLLKLRTPQKERLAEGVRLAEQELERCGTALAATQAKRPPNTGWFPEEGDENGDLPHP